MKQDAKSKTKIRTSLNYVEGEFETDYNQVKGPSETVPQQAMSAAEMLRRHSQGLPMTGQTPQYYDELEIPDLKRMDLTEIDEYRQNLLNQIKSLEDQQAEVARQAAKKLDEDRIEQAIQQRLKSMNNEKEISPKNSNNSNSTSSNSTL